MNLHRFGPGTVATAGPPARARRTPRAARIVGFDGPAHFARQIVAGCGVAPAEASRGRRALLFGAVSSDHVELAERAIRERWLVEAVEARACIVDGWQRLADETPGTLSWLQGYVLREIQRHEPDAIALLDPSGDLRGAARAVWWIRSAIGGVTPIASLHPTERGGLRWGATVHDLRASGGGLR